MHKISEKIIIIIKLVKSKRRIEEGKRKLKGDKEQRRGVVSYG